MARKVNTIFNDDAHINWLWDKYYCSGFNYRYPSFQIALNLLNQNHPTPTIIETGCQRQKGDFGAGMSTSIFGEYCARHGGKVYTVDLIKQNLDTCKECTKEYSNLITYIESDSVAWLNKKNGIVADLLYLDSYDHPYVELLNLYGGRKDPDKASEILNSMDQNEIVMKHQALLHPCQAHALNEFKAAVSSGKVNNKTIILIDDNQLPGGGKSRLIKRYLQKQDYICLFDLQQTLWVKEI